MLCFGCLCSTLISVLIIFIEAAFLSVVMTRGLLLWGYRITFLWNLSVVNGLAFWTIRYQWYQYADQQRDIDTATYILLIIRFLS